eukprot:5989859-Prymnesium_polylepis.1
MGARSAAEAQSYFVTQLRRTIGIGVFRAEAQLRIHRARELRSHAHGPEMRWGVRAMRRMRTTGTRWPTWPT